ncbi:MAG: glutamate racemase [Desulfobacteraceae bacterium]|nr:glutamate racemase [Desulfobacteraceae bacterium]
MIGVFDSGIGGLTVVKSIMAAFPDYDITFFGDTARTPYGIKNPETIIEHTVNSARFLVNNGARLMVIASNTASSIASEILHKTFGLPVFEVINPTVESAISASPGVRIGIIGTRSTVSSGIYESRIKTRLPTAVTTAAACPLIVPLVEEGWFKRPETAMIVKKYLHPLKVRQIDTLILGCSHYPVLKELIQRKIGRRVRIVDTPAAVTENIKFFLRSHPELDTQMLKTGTHQYYVSGLTPQLNRIAQFMINRYVELRHVKI